MTPLATIAVESHALAGAWVDGPDGLGRFSIAASERGVVSVSFGGQRGGVSCGDDADAGAVRIAEVAAEQLSEYFVGRRREFDVPLDLRGTDFQLAVWRRLIQIPFGETTTYGAIAADLGKYGAARAVGLANHDNPIAIIVPCHRVIGSNGSLTGYAGGLRVKRWLLDHENNGLFAGR